MVEDNPSDIALTRRAFQKVGVTDMLAVVEDGQEALDFVNASGRFGNRRADELPIIILLDVNIPGLNGLEVLKRIKSNEKTRSIVVVMLTTSSEESDLKQAYISGANSYIRKPVDFQKFADMISQLSRYWLSVNEPPPGFKSIL